MRSFLLVSVLALGACSGDGGVKDEELEGLVVSPPDEQAPIDLDKAVKDGRELGRAIALDHHVVAAGLGAHQVKVTSKIEVKENDQVVESLTDESIVEYVGDAEYHAKYDNSADYGREVVWQAGALYLRPRYARWHRRPPTDDREPGQILDQMYAVAGDYFALVAHAAEVTDKGATQVGGRAGRRVEIKLAPAPGKPAEQLLTQRKWRETVGVQALTGDAVLDGDGGAPLQIRFAATLSFSRDGRTFLMSLEVGQDVTVGAAVTVTAPPADQVVGTPERLKEVDERDQLLDGIAPPTRKGGAPGPAVAPPTTPPPGASSKE